MDLSFTLISMIILALLYILHNYLDYYKKLNKDKNEKYRNTINSLGEVIKSMSIILVMIIITGFVLYTMRQMKEHGDKWSTNKFLFGVNICDSMK